MKEQKPDRFILQAYYDKMETEDAKFLLDHAEKQLKDTLDTNALIIGRLTTLVTITTALLVGLLGYAVNRADTHNHNDRLIVTAISGMFYLYIPATLIVINFMSKKYALLGSEPKDFFIDQTFAGQNKPYLKAIYCNEIIQYQTRIKYNKRKEQVEMEPFQHRADTDSIVPAGSLSHLHLSYSLVLTFLASSDSEGRPLFSRAFAVVLISTPPHTCGSIGWAAGCGAGWGAGCEFVVSSAII